MFQPNLLLYLPYFSSYASLRRPQDKGTLFPHFHLPANLDEYDNGANHDYNNGVNDAKLSLDDPANGAES